jgi:N-methylhydantoinase A/oxoprolinase/acetone carboxylase beta subunit
MGKSTKKSTKKAARKARTVKSSATHATRQRAREEAVDAWRERFIAALRNSGNVRASCQAAGVDRSTAYRAYSASPEFAERWNEALEEAIDTLEAAAWSRARDGVVRHEPIMYQGQKVAEKVVTEYSDSLMTLLLKAHRPEKYRERFDVEIKDMRARAELAVEDFIRRTGLGRAEAIEHLKPLIPQISELVH